MQNKIQQASKDAFVVQYVASVEEAMRSLESYVPDVLISEVLLTPESGLELCRSIRLRPSLHHLPIMLLTSLSTTHDKVAGFEAGADDYIVKPFDPSQLAARIRLLIRIKRLAPHISP
jgi:DNA-binding response OmpR family regulator